MSRTTRSRKATDLPGTAKRQGTFRKRNACPRPHDEPTEVYVGSARRFKFRHRLVAE